MQVAEEENIEQWLHYSINLAYPSVSYILITEHYWLDATVQILVTVQN
jgi:hypothetical protein